MLKSKFNAKEIINLQEEAYNEKLKKDNKELTRIFNLLEKEIETKINNIKNQEDDSYDEFFIKLNIGNKKLTSEQFNAIEKIYNENGFFLNLGSEKVQKPYTGQEYHGNHIPPEYEEIHFINLAILKKEHL